MDSAEQKVQQLETKIFNLEARLARLETKDFDLRGRRTRNASDAQFPQDYTTLSQVQTIVDSVPAPPAETNVWTSDKFLLKPSPLLRIKDSTTGTTYSRIFSFGDNLLLSNNLYFDGAAWIVDDATLNGFAVLIDSNAIQFLCFPVGGSIENQVKFGDSTLGFFGAAAAAQQVLAAYTSDAENVAYTGQNNAVVGNVYAKVSDLNQLRVAYETLRAAHDDLRAKLLTSTLIA